MLRRSNCKKNGSQFIAEYTGAQDKEDEEIITKSQEFINSDEGLDS